MQPRLDLWAEDGWAPALTARERLLSLRADQAIGRPVDLGELFDVAEELADRLDRSAPSEDAVRERSRMTAAVDQAEAGRADVARRLSLLRDAVARAVTELSAPRMTVHERARTANALRRAADTGAR